MHEGDVISIDGSTGLVYVGEVPVVASPVVEYFDGSLDLEAPEADARIDDLVRAVHRIMWSTSVRWGGDSTDRSSEPPTPTSDM